MEALLRHLETKKWHSTRSRPNIVPPEARVWTKWWWKSAAPVYSEYHGDSGETYELVKAIAPDIAPGWHLTVNRNVQCHPHRDRYQLENHVMLLGDFTGGELCCGSLRTNQKGVWHRFDPRETHWTEPFEGTRYSLVLYHKPAWQLKQYEAYRTRKGRSRPGK